MIGLGAQGRRRRQAARLSVIALIAASAFAAAPANASVTLGQLGPNNSQSNGALLDYIQQGVAMGNGYQVPETGTITSWSTNAGFASSQKLAMEIFRKTRDPNFFKLVGHDGPRDLNPGLVNNFSANVPVQAGDLLGINCTTDTAVCTCSSSAPNVCTPAIGPGDIISNRTSSPPLKDGDEAAFNGPFPSSVRINVSAVFEPSNTVKVGTTSFNKKKGTATLNLDLPNPGDLVGSGKGAKVASAAGAVISKSVGAGPAQLLVKAKGKQLKTLNATGKVKLTVTITYTPTNGSPGNQSVKVKLKKKV
jgi:hypothetical protein